MVTRMRRESEDTQCDLRLVHKDTSVSDRLAFPHQNYRSETQDQRQKPEKATRPLGSEIVVHVEGSKRKKCSKGVLAKSYGTNGACREFGIAVGNVNTDGLHDSHGAKSDQSQANSWCDPWERRIARPGIHKKASCEAYETAEDTEIKTFLELWRIACVLR